MQNLAITPMKDVIVPSRPARPADARSHGDSYDDVVDMFLVFVRCRPNRANMRGSANALSCGAYPWRTTWPVATRVAAKTWMI